MDEPDGDLVKQEVITTKKIRDRELEKEGGKKEENLGQELNQEPDGNPAKQEVVITKEMVQEEEELEKEGEKEEEKLRQEHDKTWQDLNAEDREQRYKRLQFLLSKSNMYTQYLLSRMEKQREEQTKKTERIKKKQNEDLQKKQMVKSDTTGTNNNNSSKPEDLSTNLLPASSYSENTDKAGINQTADDSVSSPGPRRSTRGSKPKNSEDSPSSQGHKRGRKRKADSTANSPKISEVFKKQKTAESKTEADESITQEEQKDKENCGESSIQVSKDICSDDRITQKSDFVDSHIEKDRLGLEDEDSGIPKLFTGGELRDYQSQGYNWLKCLYENGVNGILADEMGLGKTVQCIAMMAHLVNMGVPGPFLVVTPLSTLPNWQSEFQRFAPKVPTVLYHGNQNVRNGLRRKISKRYTIRQGIEVRPVVLTSYEMTIRDRQLLQNYEWKYLIVDEGHRIKNTNCRLIRELRLYKNTHRLLLTGTPLQNNLAELWSLLNFLLPEIFDDLGSFEDWFDVGRMCGEDADKMIVKEEQQKNILSMLHQILTPFMLRRLKQDVDLKIPPKKEILVYAPLSAVQSEFYEATVNRTVLKMIEEKNTPVVKPELNENGRLVRKSKKKVQYDLMIASEKDLDETPKKTKKNIEKDEEELESWVQAIIDSQESVADRSTVATPKTSQVTVRLQNIMMQLRKCCNHPYLLEYPLTADEQFKIDEDLVSSCGKMVLLDRMLNHLKKAGHKVLIFSQMTKMLDILTDYCYLRKYSYCRLDGGYSLDERKEQMDAFNSDKEMFIFLLSTRAGGLGINLTAADTVILYDSDWNPQCDLQAQDRCHRIGQTEPVVVYRFVTANTIDQRIVERAAAKRKLEKMVIHKGKFKTGIKDFSTEFRPLTPHELQDLLKSRDHQMEMKGKDERSGISDNDLRIMLDRSDLIEKWTRQNADSSDKGKLHAKKTSISSQKEVQGLFKVIDNDIDIDQESVSEEEIKELSDIAGLS
ncbi:HELLS [Mytilus coruscus]|uniref:Proliferation-associated SNF2-like protein n=1 Tax=Mytilus coruscus TaxID=42192 RepID=A0A6J8AZX2_MYTCO|nr:HELLS [Mytilus coruscus]